MKPLPWRFRDVAHTPRVVHQWQTVLVSLASSKIGKGTQLTVPTCNLFTGSVKNNLPMEPLCHNRILQVGLVSHSFRSFGHFHTHLLQLQSNQGTLPRKSACSKLSLSWCVNHNYCVPFRDSMATQVDCDQLKAMKQFAFQQGPRVQNDFFEVLKNTPTHSQSS